MVVRSGLVRMDWVGDSCVESIKPRFSMEIVLQV